MFNLWVNFIEKERERERERGREKERERERERESGGGGKEREGSREGRQKVIDLGSKRTDK